MFMAGITSGLVTASQQNVDMKFESGFGIRIGIWNHNDHAIHNIHLKILDISGFIFCGLYGWRILEEIEAGGYDYLLIHVFGFGHVVSSAIISYYDQEEYVEKQINAHLLIIGTMVYVIGEW